MVAVNAVAVIVVTAIVAVPVVFAAVAALSLRFNTYQDTKDNNSWAHEHSCKILCHFFKVLYYFSIGIYSAAL